MRTLEDTDSSGEVVDTAGSLQGSSEDLNGGDKIVSEAVVQVALKLGDMRQYMKSNRPVDVGDRRWWSGKTGDPRRMGPQRYAYLKLENILHTLEFLLKSRIGAYDQYIELVGQPKQQCDHPETR